MPELTLTLPAAITAKPQARALTAESQMKPWTRPEAARTMAFWAVMVAFLLVLIAQTGYIIHQVSTVHCDALVQRLGLDASKVPLTFPTLGNIGPAAIPITLAMHQDKIERGDKVLVMGMGSGINAMAAEIRW